MNAERRKRLGKAIELLTRANELWEEAKTLLEESGSIVEDVASEERESYDSLPEGLQASERGERSNEIASELEGIDLNFDVDIESIIDTLTEAAS